MIEGMSPCEQRLAKQWAGNTHRAFHRSRAMWLALFSLRHLRNRARPQAQISPTHGFARERLAHAGSVLDIDERPPPNKIRIPVHRTLWCRSGSRLHRFWTNRYHAG